jgi:hypothetical protein
LPQPPVQLVNCRLSKRLGPAGSVHPSAGPFLSACLWNHTRSLRMRPGPRRGVKGGSGIREGGRIRDRGRRPHQRFLPNVFFLTQDGLRGIKSVAFRLPRLGCGDPGGGHNRPRRVLHGGEVAIAVDAEQP